MTLTEKLLLWWQTRTKPKLFSVRFLWVKNSSKIQCCLFTASGLPPKLMIIMFVDKQYFVCLILFYLTNCSSNLLTNKSETSDLTSVSSDSLQTTSSQTSTLSRIFSYPPLNSTLKSRRKFQLNYYYSATVTSVRH